jgi:Txe/YoeB family toxin of Txe-Axe toxin-antitoxin module
MRLSYKDRLVYSIDEGSRTVFVHRARTHYVD